MLVVIEVVVYDNMKQVEKTLWFRGDTLEEAAERRNNYMRQHPHSQIVRQIIF